MSTVKRKYEYYDQGVLPEEGEYGITYLTLYSSTSGNIYDGWIYDPDNKIPVSVTERTFGYRNPRFPQYCWDDEVIVDLSNPQSREESDFTQGRIVSFNTNVSPYPIVLQDIDVTEMTESERERHATTVLFTAIPLVSDAYIQAQVEVQCKCNLSPDNTSGEMRIEAFYILNDESDRTMRPNPIHTFTVSSANERHTLPWLYFNPALKHEDNNYIGVKLICTGGTAEIGISDAHEYGDAIITLTSAGLTGDKIDDSKPVRIWIEGEELVPLGYKIDISDYDVFCEYDDGSEYIVTHFCSFTPTPGTQMYTNFTLIAEYMGMHASLRVGVAIVESIELTGVDSFLTSYTLNISDYNVLGYLENGDIWDVTDLCEYSPAMGTTITQDTTLTATFTNPGSSTVSDSMLISKDGDVLVTGSNGHGLIYTLLDDNNKTIEITGDAEYLDQTSVRRHEIIEIPGNITDYMESNGLGPYVLLWHAEGKPGGISLTALTPTQSNPRLYQLCHRLENFGNIHFTSHYPNSNKIVFAFTNQRLLTSTNLMCLKNVDNSQITSSSALTGMNNMFYGCEELTHLNFMSTWNTIGCTSMQDMFSGCKNLIDISGISGLNVSSVTNMSGLFYGCENLEEVSDILWNWNPSSLQNLSLMLAYSGANSIEFLNGWNRSTWQSIANIVSHCLNLKNLRGLDGLDLSGLLPNSSTPIAEGSGIESLEGAEDWTFGSLTYIPPFIGCQELTDISAAENWDTSGITGIRSLFSGCVKLSDISPLSGWDTSGFVSTSNAFNGCSDLDDLSPLKDWDMSNVRNMSYMFSMCKARSISVLKDWDVSSVDSIPLSMFARDEDHYIYDADALTWDVPKTYLQPPGVRVEPYWRCTWLVGRSADSSLMFLGTSVPSTYQQGFDHTVNLSEKQHPLPYWYYHNDSYIDETQ